MCDEIIDAEDSVSTNVSANVTFIMPINFTNIASTDFDNKKQDIKLYFAHGFISGNTAIYNRYYSLLLHKT